MQTSSKLSSIIKNIALLLILLLAAAAAYGYFYQNNAIKTAKDQLDALKSGKETEAYYNYTSKDFQDSTSLNRFKLFLDIHPGFKKITSSDLSILDSSNTEATLRGTLYSSNAGPMPVEYRMVKENKDWKVQSITMLDISPDKKLSEEEALDQILQPITTQLDALNKKDVSKGYYNIVSDEFQHATSLKEFENFVRENPILTTQTQREILNTNIDGDTGQVTLMLTNQDKSTPVEYKLKRTHGEWRIWSIRLIMATPTDTAKESKDESIKSLANYFEALVEAYRLNKLSRAYYQYTSPSFKATMPLDRLTAFLNENAPLLNGRPDYYQGYIDEEIAFLKVYLSNQEKPIALRLTFVRDKNTWKIDTLEKLISPPVTLSKRSIGRDEEVIADLSTEEIAKPPAGMLVEPGSKEKESAKENGNVEPLTIHVVDQFMKTLRQGDLGMAYRSFTSEGFQKSNSFDVFQSFVKSYPVLTTIPPSLHFVKNMEGFASVIGDLQMPNGKAEANFLLVKEDNNWRILAINVVMPQILTTAQQKEASKPQEPQKPKIPEDPATVLFPVQRLLESLHSPDFSAAYKYYMSKGFQDTTSYENFKKVILRLPAITQGAPTFTKAKITNDIGTVSARITSPYGNADLDFSLIYENNGWKIHVINISGNTAPSPVSGGEQVRERPNPLPPENIESSSPEYPIQMQLYMIGQGDITQSYRDLTSPQFQKVTTIEEYIDFIKSYNVFTENENYQISEKNQTGDVVTYKVTLKSLKGESGSVTYDVIQSKNGWKILNMQMQSYDSPPKGLSEKNRDDQKDNSRNNPQTSNIRLAPKNALPSEANANTEGLSFQYGSFGTKVNDLGLIENPTTIFSKEKNPIYFNLYVENASKGDIITLTFKHLNSGNTIPEIRSTVQTDGTSTQSFIFAPPPNGWPEGVYEVTALGGNGYKKIYNFRVQ